MPLQATSGAASYDAFGGGAAAIPNYIEEMFSTYLYTETGSSQTITNNINLSGKGGMVWIKTRSNAQVHRIQDTARGAGNTISSDTTAGQSAQNVVSSFTTTGFNLNTYYATNTTVASWTFREQPKFFDIVTYTGTGANRTIAHNLGSVPGCIMIKRTDDTSNWAVYHRSLANTEYLVLNSVTGKATGATWWNSTTPTSTVFSLGTDATVNSSARDYVAYVFAHDAGGFGLTGTDNVISCGSFTSPALSSSVSVSLGYEPQWILFKDANSTNSNWVIADSMRGLNVSNVAPLNPNNNTIESAVATAYWSPTATGFSVQYGADAWFTPGNTVTYVAIRRGPMKVPTLGTAVFGMSARTGTGANATVTGGGGGVTDLAIIKNRGTFDPNSYTARLIGAYYTSVSDTMVEAAAGATILQSNPWDVMSGIKVGTTSTLTNASSNTFINYLFTRAPTVFDIVCFKGTGGTSLTVTHNLGAVPQFIITINRSAAANCLTYNPTSGATKYLPLNSDQANLTNSGAWNNTAPTSSVFTVGSFFNAQNYIAFLFATLAGVSKVGTYTGNGSTQTIDCGFGAGGARFVLLKRTDAAGDWYVYDTARGMTVLTDPYFLMDTNAGDVATLGSVTTVSTGFALNSAILAAINVNTGTYIFLAIA